MRENVNTDKNSKEEVLSKQDKALLGLAGLLAFIINVFATYFTILIGWNQFLTKIFTMPAIGFPQVLAILTVIGFIRFNVSYKYFVKKEQKVTPKTVMSNTGTIVGTYTFTLLVLWVITALV